MSESDIIHHKIKAYVVKKCGIGSANIESIIDTFHLSFTFTPYHISTLSYCSFHVEYLLT